MDEDSRKIDETQDQLEIPAIDGRRDISPRAVVQLFGLNPVSRMSRISVPSYEEITSMTRWVEWRHRFRLRSKLTLMNQTTGLCHSSHSTQSIFSLLYENTFNLRCLTLSPTYANRLRVLFLRRYSHQLISCNQRIITYELYDWLQVSIKYRLLCTHFIIYV